MRILTAATLAFAIAGCGHKTTPAMPAMMDMAPSFVAANSVPHGDATETGELQFLHDTWDTEQLDEWPPAEFMLGLMKSEPDVFGNQFQSFGFIPDPGDDLPVGFKRGQKDPSKVHETCAMCHVAKLPDGRIWLGAPNSALDFGRFVVEVSHRWVAAGHPALLSALAEKKSLQLGPGRTDAESGSYPNVVPADFPQYFALGRRTRTNYLGTGRNVRTEAFLSIFTFGAGDPNPQTAKVPFPSDDRTQSFLDFFGVIQAPTPPAQDATLIARGQAAFDKAQCGACHHVDMVELDGIVPMGPMGATKELIPGADPNYPRGTILTDRQHRALVDGAAADDPSPGMDQGYVDLLHFIQDHMLQAAPTDGYRVNDLHGLWATAPYLHNGSVPTLEALLTPQAARPTVFQQHGFTVDTTQLGSSNAGHEFGSDLSADDRTALVAYLKSL